MMRTLRRSYLRLTHPFPREISVGGRARALPLKSWSPVIRTTSGRLFHNGTYSPPKFNTWRPVIPQSSSHFIYKPLTRSSAIRLVILEPGRGEDPVRCHLIHVSLDDNPQYEALSYAWGDPSVTTPIYLDGKAFPVTENLESALVNLRDESLENPKDRVLWIDAICINQMHIPERNDQVQRMRDIYGNAVMVLIWIGRYHETVDNSLRDIETWGIHTLEEGTREQTQKTFEFMAKICKLASQDEYEMQILIASATKHDWVHLERLLNRPWFERLWVVQEVYLAQRTRLICGRVECEWTEFSHACQFLSLSALASSTASPSAVNFILLALVSYGNPRIHAKLSQVPKQAIILLLRNLSHFSCTDPRDRLYAILGICCDGEGINVDYSKPVQQVYADWAWSHIEETSGLDVFSLGNYTLSSTAGLPSWVPNLQPGQHTDFDVDPLLYRSTLARGLSEEPEELALYSASRGSLSDASLSKDRLCLALSGTRAGRIAGIFDVHEFDEPETDEALGSADPTPSLDYLAGLRISKISALEADVAQHFGFPNLAYASPLWYEFTDVLFRGLEQTLTLKMFRAIDDLHYRYAVLRGFEPIPLDFGGDLDEKARRKEYLVTVHLAVNMVARQIRMFVTAEGRLGLAMLSSNVQIGDEVYVLLGGNTPYVLRKDEESYRLITPCYLYGFMNGEAMDGLEAGKYKLEKVTLV